MREERKWGRKIVWAPCPIFPQTFPSKMGGLWDKFVFPPSALRSFIHSQASSLLKRSTPDISQKLKPHNLLLHSFSFMYFLSHSIFANKPFLSYWILFGYSLIQRRGFLCLQGRREEQPKLEIFITKLACDVLIFLQNFIFFFVVA